MDVRRCRYDWRQARDDADTTRTPVIRRGTAVGRVDGGAGELATKTLPRRSQWGIYLKKMYIVFVTIITNAEYKKTLFSILALTYYICIFCYRDIESERRRVGHERKGK